MAVGRENILSIIAMMLDPAMLIISLWSTAVWFEQGLSPPYLLLSVVVFSLTFPGRSYLGKSVWYIISRIIGSWLMIVVLLAFFGYAGKYLGSFDSAALLTWLWLAPATQISAQLALKQTAPAIVRMQGDVKRAVIAGLNAQGLELARTIVNNPFLAIKPLGFYDDRSHDRLERQVEFPILGRMEDLASHVKQNNIDVIYLSLPMATQPRILDLLDQLRDTTASIYFLPDIFVTDLIQGRMDAIDGIPVVAVCETPFTGVNGLVKRLSDVVLSMLILLLISPLMIAIAVAVKMSSPGPVLFQQRRYGLDGKAITVYKFRSMTVCEDGGQIRQAQKDDKRVTSLGALLRRTSLDELPQFVNVVQGRMSIVGPRPHAVAHNEEYRTLIKGYMVRHKVKPGITGWAQVNGYRGETDTLDKMSKRIEFDLNYLRHWSLRFDLSIIMKTVILVLRDRNAY